MEILRTIAMFESLDAEAFASLEKMARIKKYNKGAILFFEGDSPDSVVILTKGVLKLFKTTQYDKEVVLHYFTPVTLVAEAAMLHRIPYPATATFESDSEVILIDYKTFESCFLSNIETAKELIFSLSRKVRMLESVIERGMVMDAAERVYSLIQKSPEVFESLRNFEIANVLNISPETLSRILKKLQQDEKIVKTASGWKTLV